MTPDERAIQDRKQLESDLKDRGAISMPLSDEIRNIETYLEQYEKDQLSDPRAEAVEAEKKRFKLITLKLTEDVLSLAKMPQFRRFCWKILEEAGLFKMSYTRGSAEETALREGRRSVGLDVLAIIQTVDPGIFLQMQKEHVSDIRSRENNS